MTERLPLFPLGTVLFPGVVLPLHIFEERYRMLVRHLLEHPEPRRFGVVAIELGHEVGTGGTRRLAPVGCTAELHGMTSHADGRFDLVTVGGTRFRVERTDTSLPYLRGEVTFLPEATGRRARWAAERVRALFSRYRDKLAGAGAEVAEAVELPADAVGLSYSVAAAMVLDRDDRQRLLEAADATGRLALEHQLLQREIRLLDALPTVPASQFIDGSVHPN